MTNSRTYIAIPPGATIREQLEDRGMSQKEFAMRMGFSQKHISQLINGDVHLTQEAANRLEMVLGLPAQFWNSLESIYREKIQAVQIENEMDEDKELSKRYPYAEMAKNGWVPKTRKAEEKVIALRGFFEIARLNFMKDCLLPQIACRRQGVTEKADYALLAWAQQAKREAREIETAKINLDKLAQIIPSLRAMTSADPNLFCPDLVESLADCGIALVFLPHIGGSFLHGASFYDGDKIVVGLTVRGKDADKFWFSFFHELGHIMLGHIGKPEGTTDEDEEQANMFAQETLIPGTQYRAFIDKELYRSRQGIVRFAEAIGIDPGIVVGRLQRNGYLDYSQRNDLKSKYQISA